MRRNTEKTTQEICTTKNNALPETEKAGFL